MIILRIIQQATAREIELLATWLWLKLTKDLIQCHWFPLSIKRLTLCRMACQMFLFLSEEKIKSPKNGSWLLKKWVKVVRGHAGLISILIIQHLPHRCCCAQVLDRELDLAVCVKCFESEVFGSDKQRTHTHTNNIYIFLFHDNNPAWDFEYDRHIKLPAVPDITVKYSPVCLNCASACLGLCTVYTVMRFTTSPSGCLCKYVFSLSNTTFLEKKEEEKE